MKLHSHADIQEAARSELDAVDVAYMGRALDWAKKGESTPGGNPIGCVIVQDGKIVGEGFNECNMRCDPTAHAEMVAIRRACEVLQTTELRGATLYATLQPCGMCSMASIWAKIGRVVYGAERGDVHEMYFEERDRGTVDYVLDAYREDITLRSGVLAEECAVLYVGPEEDVPTEEQVNLCFLLGQNASWHSALLIIFATFRLSPSRSRTIHISTT